MKVPSSPYVRFKITVMRMLRNRLFLIVIFLVGIAVGFFIDKLHIFKEKQITSYNLQRLYLNSSGLVNPLILVENSAGGDSKLESIKYSIQEYIDKCKQRGDASNVSVYLRDLNKGTWIGIDEDKNYAAASLIKMPLMLVYLKTAEQRPAILSEEIKYDTTIEEVPQNVIPEDTVKLGNTYTVEQLLDYMIRYSDNAAGSLLLKNIDTKLIVDLYSNLQLPVPDFTEYDYQVSAKTFATFFRVLYNATFLNEYFSSKALKLLSKTDFSGGIVASVPADIVVAHKFGERRYANKMFSSEGTQLHDCGIVYYPKGPYLICVMTKGSDFNTLKGIIKDISKIVYEQEEKTMDVY